MLMDRNAASLNVIKFIWKWKASSIKAQKFSFHQKKFIQFHKKSVSEANKKEVNNKNPKNPFEDKTFLCLANCCWSFVDVSMGLSMLCWTENFLFPKGIQDSTMFSRKICSCSKKSENVFEKLNLYLNFSIESLTDSLSGISNILKEYDRKQKIYK